MSAAPLHERVAAALEGIPHETADSGDGTACVELARELVHAALKALRDRAGFESNSFVTAVDHYPAAPRFQVVYQLISFEHNDRIRVQTRIDEQDAWVPSCTDLWPGAGFSERECWDMFGVRFEGNPDLRRLLMPEEYEHHPLRKEFPHHGIEPDRLYREWDRQRREEYEAQ